MGTMCKIADVSAPRDYRAERVVNLNWRPYHWNQKRSDEKIAFLLERREMVLKVAFEDGNADVASGLLQKYIIPTIEYQNNVQGRYVTSYEDMKIEGQWDKHSGGDGRGYNQFAAILSWRDIRSEEATFNSEYARNDKGNTDRAILSFMGNCGTYKSENAHIIKQEYEENRLEERIAYKLLRLSSALRSGEAKFEFKPY